MRLQLLLKQDYRHPKGVEEAKRAIEAVGMTPTASGLATVSADVSPDVFQRLFAGVREGADQSLNVPKGLEHCIDSISIAPTKHLRFE